MTTSQVRYRWKCRIAAVILALAPVGARADEARTGDEPWYRQSSVEDRQEAQALFEQARAKHQQLLRGEARELYEQALTRWDNPDIRWNLALVLEDLAEYLLAYQQLDSVLHWGAVVGIQRLHDVQDRMRALETRRLARVEARSDEVGAQIRLDGSPWFTGAGSRNELVGPGEHYVSASKPGYFPVTIPVYVTMGLQAHVVLQMEADRLIGTPRWPSWKPWAAVAAGLAITAAGAGLEWHAFARRDVAAHAVATGCASMPHCDPVHTPDIYDRAVTEQRFAIGMFGVGGAVMTVGLVVAWLNRPLWHRSEPRARSIPTFTPILGPNQTGASALIRF